MPVLGRRERAARVAVIQLIEEARQRQEQLNLCERARWLRRRGFSPVEHEQLLLEQIGELRLNAERKRSLQLVEFFVIKSNELTSSQVLSDQTARENETRPASARAPRPTWCEYAAAKRKSALAVLRARTAASATHS